MTFIQELAESKYLGKDNRGTKYTGDDLVDCAFIHLLALTILSFDPEYRPYTMKYAHETSRFSDFRSFHVLTDLYGFLHGIETTVIGDPNYRVTFDRARLLKFLREMARGKLTMNDAAAMLLKLERQLHITDHDYSSCRRFAGQWLDLDAHQQKLVATRLLFAFKHRCPKSQLGKVFAHWAESRKMHYKDVGRNPETGEVIAGMSAAKKVGLGLLGVFGIAGLAIKSAYDERRPK